jgi:hypothetical protein
MYRETIMKIIINENQFNAIIDEMAYPSSWNIETFKQITSFNKRVEYCNQHLTRLGSGSARIVYQIDDDKVLKLAKNKKGIAQNEVEYDPYLSSSFDIFAKVFDADDENFTWIEMELARPVKIADFKKYVGYSFNDICMVIKQAHYDAHGRNKYGPSTNYDLYAEMVENNEWVSQLEEYIHNYNVPQGDLLRKSTYGIVKRNGQEELVIIDYGLDDNVFNNYYAR